MEPFNVHPEYKIHATYTSTSPTDKTTRIPAALFANREIALPNKDMWKMHTIQNSKTATESGTASQFSVIISKGALKIAGRVKSLKNINEALVYHKITNSQDPLLDNIPKFLGVLDKEGNQINLEGELKKLGEAQLIEKYRPAYLIMGDLMQNLGVEETVEGSAKDFKFAKSTLIGNHGEVIKHKQTKHGAIHNWIKSHFFGLSKCAFAFQEATTTQGKGWFTWVIISIKRLISVKNTKNALVSQFNHMNFKELSSNIESLKKLKQNLQNSNFTFVDSSLLFIPIKKIVDDVATFQITIKLVDLAHGMHQEENIPGFDVVKNDMVNSVDELIQIMQIVCNKKSTIAYS